MTNELEVLIADKMEIRINQGQEPNSQCMLDSIQEIIDNHPDKNICAKAKEFYDNCVKVFETRRIGYVVSH